MMIGMAGYGYPVMNGDPVGLPGVPTVAITVGRRSDRVSIFLSISVGDHLRPYGGHLSRVNISEA